MSLSDAIEKFGRTIFERPFNSARLSDEAPELAEIRIALLDAAKGASHRAGSVRVFPFDTIRVNLRGIPSEQAPSFESGALADFLAEDLRAALARSNIRFSTNLKLAVHTTPDLPLTGEPWLAIETEKSPVPAAESERPRTIAKLTVVEGVANVAELQLTRSRVNIGRTVNVYRSSGPSRRNDLAFVEDNEINKTVSREHAHIRIDKSTGEHRLMNDRYYQNPDSCELWILRDGMSRPVHRGSRGVQLESGDEIHIGRAVLKFEAL